MRYDIYIYIYMYMSLGAKGLIVDHTHTHTPIRYYSFNDEFCMLFVQSRLMASFIRVTNLCLSGQTADHVEMSSGHHMQLHQIRRAKRQTEHSLLLPT